MIGSRQLRDELASFMDDLSEVTAIIVTFRGEGRAVLLAFDRYNEMIDRLEYLEDSLDAAQASWAGAVPLGEID